MRKTLLTIICAAALALLPAAKAEAHCSETLQTGLYIAAVLGPLVAVVAVTTVVVYCVIKAVNHRHQRRLCSRALPTPRRRQRYACQGGSI